MKALVAALWATRSIRCADQACSLGPSGDDRERVKMSGKIQGRTLSRYAPEGAVFSG